MALSVCLGFSLPSLPSQVYPLSSDADGAHSGARDVAAAARALQGQGRKWGAGGGDDRG